MAKCLSLISPITACSQPLPQEKQSGADKQAYYCHKPVGRNTLDDEQRRLCGVTALLELRHTLATMCHTLARMCHKRVGLATMSHFLQRVITQHATLRYTLLQCHQLATVCVCVCVRVCVCVCVRVCVCV